MKPKKDLMLEVLESNKWKKLGTATFEIWGNGKKRALRCPGCGKIKAMYTSHK